MKPTTKSGEHSWSTSCTNNDNYHDDDRERGSSRIAVLKIRLGGRKGNGDIDVGKVTLVQTGIHSLTKTQL